MPVAHQSIRIERKFVVAVVALGFTAIITQIVLLREFLSVFYGNELVIGIILANWMILTGVGSYLGKISEKLTNKPNIVPAIFLVLAIFPLVTVFLLDYLRNIIFPIGSMVGIQEILFTSFILLVPYCVCAGFAFTLLAFIISDRYIANLIAKTYSWEAFGSVVGGLIFNFLLLYFLKTFQILLLLMAFNFLIAGLFWMKDQKPVMKSMLMLLSVGLIIILFIWNLDDVTKKLLFKDQTIVHYEDTPYGNLVITQQAEQKNFFENNLLLFSTGDPTANEEAVHYAMLQHPAPKNILLISGGISGTTEEILKYNIDRIDYVEINPWLIDIGKKYTSYLMSKKINIINEDARMFIRKTPETYDVVLINLPDPTTAQLNRYFTVEFFRELKKRLRVNGVISLGVLSSVDYWGEDARGINSIMYNTLKTSFRNIVIIPGMKNYFVASDDTLRIDIARLVEERKINNTYVNRYYIDDEIIRQRSSEILRTLNRDTKLNEDFSPIAYYKQLIFWLSQYEVNYWIVLTFILIVVIFILKNLNPVTFGMFTGGFAASSIEIILLISFQIIYGYVYQALGLVITIFMAGLGFGCLYRHKIFSRQNIQNYIGIQFGIGVFAILLPVFLLSLTTLTEHTKIVQAIFLISTFIIAGLIGMEFSLATRLQSGTVASITAKLYSADLFGSAIGAIVVTAYLVPLFGIVKVCFVIAFINFTSAIICWVNRKKYSIVPM